MLGSVHFTYRHPIEVGQSAGQSWKLSREKSGGALPMGICHAVSMAVYQVGAAPEWVASLASRLPAVTMRGGSVEPAFTPLQAVGWVVCLLTGGKGLRPHLAFYFSD